ncbi:major capsid protein [Pseudoxanthomonas mexicana]
MDVADAVATLAGIGTAIGLIGAAKLAPAAISVGWKWAKGAIFG